MAESLSKRIDEDTRAKKNDVKHVERCCANAFDFVEPHMDDRETKEMLSRVEQKV